jgi:hypothetical protein
MAVKALEVSRDLVAARIAELEEQLAKEKQILAAARPVEPEFTASVVRFQKFDYSWAAIKVGGSIAEYIRTGRADAGRWYVTQDGSRSARQGIPPKTWSELLEWIGERNWDTIEVLA